MSAPRDREYQQSSCGKAGGRYSRSGADSGPDGPHLPSRNEREIDRAFKSIADEKLDALFVAADAYFGARREQFVALAAYEAIPAFYARREFVEAGGLVSYGTDLNATNRQQGVYVGRILKGEKPADLPVLPATKFELVINLKTAKALGVSFSDNVMSLADEVIE
jgi:putative tryptophan/tyrosine transport system substrate-binding protein